MKLKYKDLIKALNAIEDERRVPEEVVLEALKEEKYEVVVDKEIAAKARVGIQKMLDLS